MVTKFGEEPLSCVYSSYPKSTPAGSSGSRAGARTRCTTCISSGRAAGGSRGGCSPKASPCSPSTWTPSSSPTSTPSSAGHRCRAHDVIISRNSDESQSLNCGFVYFNLKAARHASKVQEEHCLAGDARGAPPLLDAPSSAGAVPAAEWVARAMWERIELFLDVDKKALSHPPVREVLWEQDAWNDLAKTLETRRRIFPWAVGYGKDSDLWPTLGYKRQRRRRRTPRGEVGQVAHAQRQGVPAVAQPDEVLNAKAFYDRDLRKPLLWLPSARRPTRRAAETKAPLPSSASRRRGCRLA